MDTETHFEFELADLYKNVKYFGFIAGSQRLDFREQDPVNIRAAELMGDTKVINRMGACKSRKQTGVLEYSRGFFI